MEIIQKVYKNQEALQHEIISEKEMSDAESVIEQMSLKKSVTQKMINSQSLKKTESK